jgi:S-(hydroxymethyl)mycothiol dehydrogenase
MAQLVRGVVAQRKVGRGDSIAVIGCGGVGNAAIAGARLAGASTIIGIDVDDRKLQWAREFGATHTINSRDADPVEGVQALTDGNGANVVVDAVGRPETFTQAFYARDLAGTVVLVGVPNPQWQVELPLIDTFGRGGATKSSWYGDCLPSRDFPMLVDLHLQGRLPLESSSPRPSRSTTSRRPSRRCTAARSCARW